VTLPEDTTSTPLSAESTKVNGERPPPLLFLSYGSENGVEARELRRILTEAGYRVWMAPDDIRGPESWPDQVLNAIGKSQMMVILVSSDALASPHVGREVNLAIEQGKPLLPVRVADVKVSGTLAYLLALVQWVDVFPPPLAHHQQLLVDRIKDLLADIDIPVSSPPPAPPPVSSPPVTPAPLVSQTGQKPKRRARWLIPVGLVALAAAAFLIYQFRPQPADDTAPGQPTAFSAEALSGTQVRLEWRAPDEEGVDGFTIYRDGAELTTVSEGVTEYIDGSVEAGITYEYQLDTFANGVHSTRTAARLVEVPDSGLGTTTAVGPSTTVTGAPSTTVVASDVDPQLLAFFEFAEADNCSNVLPADFVSPDIEREIACESPGMIVYYTVWNSLKGVEARTEFHNEIEPASPWFSDTIERGMLTSYLRDDGEALIYWSYEDEAGFPVTGEALRSDGDLSALSAWWSDIGSQVTTDLTRTSAEDDLLSYLLFTNTNDCGVLRQTAIVVTLAELRCDVIADGFEIRAYVNLWPTATDLDAYVDDLVTSYAGVLDTWSYTAEGDATIGRTVEYFYEISPWFFWTYDGDLVSVNATPLTTGTLDDLRFWWENGAAGRP
jgi:hypothetical protein